MKRRESNPGLLSPNWDPGWEVSAGDRTGARIHRMFLNSGGCRLKFQILPEGNGGTSRGAENERVCWLAQFSKLFLILCSRRPCELGSIAPICEIRKLRSREGNQPPGHHTVDAGHGKGGHFRTRWSSPFAGIPGEPLWSGPLDRKNPWAAGFPWSTCPESVQLGRDNQSGRLLAFPGERTHEGKACPPFLPYLFSAPLPDCWNLNLVQTSSRMRVCLLNQPWLLPRCYCWYVPHVL